MHRSSPSRFSVAILDPASVKAPSALRAAGRRERWRVVASLLGALLFALAGAGCGETLGADCDDDSDCDEGQICGDPQATSASICFIPCETDSECEDNAGSGSTCQLLPQASSGYCSAAD
jgi:hypothetical protein